MSNGFDDLIKELNDISKKAQELGGEHNVPLPELLTDSFISENTSFKSLDEFFEKSGFDVSSSESFDAIPDEDLDKFVSENSNFEDWSDMLGTAGTEYFSKKLGF